MDAQIKSKMDAPQPKAKKGFKMPHLFFLMLGLLIFMSLMTYVIPAGQFAKNADGTINGKVFTLLGHQTPVDPWNALLCILPGLQNSAYVIALLLTTGGAIGVILQTKAIDRVIDYILYVVQEKGVVVVVPIVTFMFGLLGAFGGGDYLVALIPIGIMMAKKLKVDPIMAMGLTLFPIFIGGTWSPTGLIIHWTMMDLPLYSGVAVRTVMMFIIIALDSLLITRYALKVKKDPTKSLIGNTDWVKDLVVFDESAAQREVKLAGSDVFVTIMFFLQFVLVVLAMTVFKMDKGVQLAIMILSAIVCGFAARMKTDEIGNAFAKGAGGMAFVAFIIGIANALSLVMTNGNILHTIVYYACLPLSNLGFGAAAIGISVVITFINLLIPSASAKAAILFPIVRPMTEALGLTKQVGVEAFQLDDQFTNAISPCLGMTVAGCAAAGVDFGKYVKFAIRIIAPLWLLSEGVLFVLANMGWTGL